MHPYRQDHDQGDAVGEYRSLKADEVKHLYKLVEKAEAEAAKPAVEESAGKPLRGSRRAGGKPGTSGLRREGQRPAGQRRKKSKTRKSERGT